MVLTYNEKLQQKRRKASRRKLLRLGLLTISAVISVAFVLTKGQIQILAGR